MSSSSAPELVDGVDVDAVAAAVLACPGVDTLSGGPGGALASYLPGRRVDGVRVTDDAVTVQVGVTWGALIPNVATSVRTAAQPLVGGRRIDVAVADIGDPPVAAPALTG